MEEEVEGDEAQQGVNDGGDVLDLVRAPQGQHHAGGDDEPAGEDDDDLAVPDVLQVFSFASAWVVHRSTPYASSEAGAASSWRRCRSTSR